MKNFFYLENIMNIACFDYLGFDFLPEGQYVVFFEHFDEVLPSFVPNWKKKKKVIKFLSD